MMRGRLLSKKIVATGIGLILLSIASTVLLGAENHLSSDEEIYIRYLTPQDLELEPAITYDAEKFLNALQSNDNKTIYIAINRLVETFNDSQLRQKALDAIRPFIEDDNEKIREAAKFAVGVLSQTLQSEFVYELADGSVVFTLFNNYSAYGSQNVIWRIKDDVLEEYTSFSKPLMYIKTIIPSPDKTLFAVVMGSNKSDFVVISDAINYRESPELIESARIRYGADTDKVLWTRSDHENYTIIDTIEWENDNTLVIESQMPYFSGIEDVIITYTWGTGNMEVAPKSD